jgi:hypothetical protein
VGVVEGVDVSAMTSETEESLRNTEAERRLAEGSSELDDIQRLGGEQDLQGRAGP